MARAEDSDVSNAPEKFIKIRVSDRAKKSLKETAKELDMLEVGVASRLIEWFATIDDDALRKGILGILPKHYEADVAKLALERMASSKGKAK